MHHDIPAKHFPTMMEDETMDDIERAIVRPGDPLADVLVEIADRLDQQCDAEVMNG